MENKQSFENDSDYDDFFIMNRVNEEIVNDLDMIPVSDRKVDLQLSRNFFEQTTGHLEAETNEKNHTCVIAAKPKLISEPPLFPQDKKTVKLNFCQTEVEETIRNDFQMLLSDEEEKLVTE